MGMVMVLLLIGSVTLVSHFAGVLGLQLYISEDREGICKPTFRSNIP